MPNIFNWEELTNENYTVYGQTDAQTTGIVIRADNGSTSVPPNGDEEYNYSLTKLGLFSRVNSYLKNSSTNVPYAYVDSGVGKWVGASGADEILQTISRHQKYYREVGNNNSDNMVNPFNYHLLPAVRAYITRWRFEIQEIVSFNPLTLKAIRRNETYDNFTSSDFYSKRHHIPKYFNTPSNTHGLASATRNYAVQPTGSGDVTKGLPCLFDRWPLDYPDEWGEVLNTDAGGGPSPTQGFFILPDGPENVIVYEDVDCTIPVDASGWTAIDVSLLDRFPLCRAGSATDGFPSGQIVHLELLHRGTRRYFGYDAVAGESVVKAPKVGRFRTIVSGKTTLERTPDYFRIVTDRSTSNVDGIWDTASDDIANLSNEHFMPDITITMNGLSNEYNGTNGYIDSISLNPELCGLFAECGRSFEPSTGGSESVWDECIIEFANPESDSQPNFDFRVVEVAVDGAGSTVTFENPVIFNGNKSIPVMLRGFVGNAISGVKQGILRELFARPLAMERVTDTEYTLFWWDGTTTPDPIVGVYDSSTKDLTTTGTVTYDDGARGIEDFDDRAFELFDFAVEFGRPYTVDRRTGGDNQATMFYYPWDNLPVDPSNEDLSQEWPKHVAPAKADVELIHNTRVNYGIDLSKYRNSIGSSAYKITYQYSYITHEEWKIFDTFINEMQGQYSAFLLPLREWDDGGSWNGIFASSTTSVSQWNSYGPIFTASEGVLAGDTHLKLTGFPVDLAEVDGDVPTAPVVLRDGDILRLSNLSNFSKFTGNNFLVVSGDTRPNRFGEAMVKLRSPVKNSMERTVLEQVQLVEGIEKIQVTLNQNSFSYNFHPRGFVSFTVGFDVMV